MLMGSMLDFNDYLFNSIFENDSEMVVILSDRLYDLLLGIENNPIAEDLLKINEEEHKSVLITLIDYDDDIIGNLTYITPPKIKDYIKRLRPELSKNVEIIHTFGVEGMTQLGSNGNYPELWKKNRNSTSINRVINKLFPGKYKASGDPGNDLESFKNLFISERQKEEDGFNRFKIVDGDDIVKYYLEENYYNSDGTPLGKSCMKYEKCSSFIEFYSENKGVKLLVLFSKKESDKIIGRSLIWDIEYINDEKVDRKFMDRIYTVYDFDIDLFKKYAEKNNWLYKDKQNMQTNELIYDPLTKGKQKYNIITTSTFYETNEYPYLDTLKLFYYKDNYLTNFLDTKKPYYYLENLDGTYVNPSTNDDYIYVEYYESSFDPDDLIWCDLGQEYRLISDAKWLGNFGYYATSEYIDDNLVWSDPEWQFIYGDFAVKSDFYVGEYINITNSFLVYKEGSAAKDFEEIHGDEDYMNYVLIRDKSKYNFVKYYVEDMYFHRNDEKYFVNCKSLKNNGKFYISVHKKWDKERIFELDGKMWVNDVGDSEKAKEILAKIKEDIK